MSQDNDRIRIKVRSGDSEAEIDSPMSGIREAIELIPDLLAKLPQGAVERAPAPTPVVARGAEGFVAREPPAAILHTANPASPPSSLPSVTIEKGDSLSDVISKFFSDPWGRNPRKLNEIREALQSYGLNYPKQSVAVALLRLAKGSRLRRFKGDGGEYVYTASTGTVSLTANVAVHPHLHPRPPAEEPVQQQQQAADRVVVEEEEEQLDLDAPAIN